MLDVHPPEHPAHSWKDFSIHIATIVVGLLIAIGLEQTVEYIHHRHELADARQQLESDYKINLAIYRAQRKDFERFIPILERNLRVLEYVRAHPGAPQSSWPGRVSWATLSATYHETSWQVLQKSPVLALFPRKELERNTELYSYLSRLSDQQREATSETSRALRYFVRGQDLDEMTPAQLDEAIDATTDVLSSYREMRANQIGLHMAFPDFAPAPTPNDARVFNSKNMEILRPEQDARAVMNEEQELTDETRRIEAQDGQE